MFCNRSLCNAGCFCFGLSAICKITDGCINLRLYKSLVYIEAKEKLPQLLSCADLISFTVVNSNLSQLSSQMFLNCNQIKSINFINTKLIQIESDAFMGLESLREVHFDGCLLFELEANAFRGLTTLNSLDLSALDLKNIFQKSFNKLDNLIKMNLSHNDFREFPLNMIETLPRLQVLDITNTSLTSLTDTNVSVAGRISLMEPTFLCCYEKIFKCPFLYTRSLCVGSLGRNVRLSLFTYGSILTVANLIMFINTNKLVLRGDGWLGWWMMIKSILQ